MRQIIFGIGSVILGLVIGGFVFMESHANFPNANQQTVAILATEIPATPHPPDTELIATFEAWQATHRDLYLRLALVDDYPLWVPNTADVDIPEYYNGYDKQITGMVISENKAFIAINYRFKQNVGGGTSAYAAHYGWDIDEQFGALYATGDVAACVDENFVATLNTFNLENGLFIILPDNSVIETNLNSLTICSES